MEFLVGYACLKDITKGVFDKYMIPFAQQLAKDGKIPQFVISVIILSFSALLTSAIVY
jgi:hypothetical protein